jgi:exodeoxyribonuclease VII small subunit
MEEIDKLSYKEALERLEKLVVKLEDPTIHLEDIATDVKSAMELIRVCREKVKGYKEESTSLLE